MKKTIQYKSNSTSIPVLTSLEEEAVPRYIQNTGHLGQGGRNSSWNQVKSTDGEFINAEMRLNWAYLSTWGLIWLTHQPIHWHIGPNTEKSTKNHPVDPKTCWGEREGEISHKYHCRSTLDMIWSPPSVKDLSDPVNLLQIWFISVKSIENPLIYLILDLLHYSSIY